MFHKLYPNIKIQIINRVTHETVELLKKGKIDLAFGNLPIEDEALEIKNCMTVHDTFVAGNDFKEHQDKNPVFELGAHELLLQLAKINLGVSCVIKEFSEEYIKNGDVFELKQNEPIPERNIGFFYSKNLSLTPAMKEFMKFFKTV